MGVSMRKMSFTEAFLNNFRQRRRKRQVNEEDSQSCFMKTVPKCRNDKVTTCKNVTREVCVDKPKRECSPLPEQCNTVVRTCRYVPNSSCRMQQKRQCRPVMKKICKNEPVKKCSATPRE